MAIDGNGRNAKSAFCKIALSDKENFELIGAKLYTGRTHQIIQNFLYHLKWQLMGMEEMQNLHFVKLL
jgi:23S rRNA-/tRNA-specific pseudouridylate synthase